MSSTVRPKTLLLINPWIYDFSAFDLWMKPLGLLYLAAHLRENGHRIHLIDCLDRHNPALLKRQGLRTPKIRHYGIGKFFREQRPKPAILRHIPANYCCYGLPEEIFLAMLRAAPVPDAILVTSMMTYWYPGVFRAIALLKEHFPGVPVILGGIYATLCADHARSHSQADYVCAEHEPDRIVTAIHDILAISAKPLSAQLFDYSPAFDLYSHLDYAGLLTSVGCPYRCSYCASHALAPRFAQRDPQAVFQELRHLYHKFGIRHFAVYDDALLVKAPEHLEPFMQQVIEADLDCTFHTPNGLHARHLGERTAALMYRSGFKTIRLSLETVNSERQRDTGGKVSSAELAQAVACLKQAGFTGEQIGVYLFIGLPGQALAETEDTIRYVHSLGVQAHLCEYSPIPGTPDWPILEQQGLVRADDDPLLHNNSIFIFHKQRVSFERMRHLKDWVRTGNQHIKSSA